MESDKWYKNNNNNKVWWYDNSDVVGVFLFSFDKIKVYNLYRDYPYRLSDKEKEVFDKENPFWANFFNDRR